MLNGSVVSVQNLQRLAQGQGLLVVGHGPGHPPYPLAGLGTDGGKLGAAVATVLSQLASAVFVLVSLRGKRMPIRLGWGGFAKQTMRKIISFGFSLSAGVIDKMMASM